MTNAARHFAQDKKSLRNEWHKLCLVMKAGFPEVPGLHFYLLLVLLIFLRRVIEPKGPSYGFIGRKMAIVAEHSA